MSIDPAVARVALDHLITAATALRDELLRIEQVAAEERRLIAQIELAALFDLEAAAADAELE